MRELREGMDKTGNEHYYNRPNRWQRWMNQVAGKLGLATVITVSGRVSGEPRSATVIPIVMNNQEYLVAPRGETDWVRNLRVAGQATLRKRSKTRAISTVELDGEERRAVIEAYKQKLGWMVAHEFGPETDPTRHPTFRITAID